MFCLIYRWLISRQIDMQRPAGKILRRHISNCRECNEFYHYSHALAHRLHGDIPRAKQAYITMLRDKVLSDPRWKNHVPANDVQKETTKANSTGTGIIGVGAGIGAGIGAGRTRAGLWTRRYWLRPALAAAGLAIIILVYSLFLWPGQGNKVKDNNTYLTLNKLASFVMPINTQANSADNANSSILYSKLPDLLARPMEQEIKKIQQDTKYAGKFVLACLPVDIIAADGDGVKNSGTGTINNNGSSNR